MLNPNLILVSCITKNILNAETSDSIHFAMIRRGDYKCIDAIRNCKQ
jgi:hypothetical protein